MKFQSHYSNSTANLYVVTASNGKRLLVECGCTWKKLLKTLNYDLSNITGCLLTHEHKDHSKAVEDVLEAGIKVYSGYGTFDALGIDGIDARNACILHDKNYCNINGCPSQFTVLPFAVNHDAAEPMGFIINSDENPIESMLFVTDTSHIKARFALEFNVIALSCSYDAEVLHKREASGDINTELAKRLLTSHMEADTTKSYIRDCCNLDKCTEIHLLHMSSGNINREETRAEIEREFMIKTFVAGG